MRELDIIQVRESDKLFLARLTKTDPQRVSGSKLYPWLGSRRSVRVMKASESNRLRGATVARLTPDQKAACSNHVGVMKFLKFLDNPSV